MMHHMTGGDSTRHTPERERQIREAGLDDTIEQSFPASDPPSTDPNPDNHDDLTPETPEDVEAAAVSRAAVPAATP
jgi:hypothetical protein